MIPREFLFKSPFVRLALCAAVLWPCAVHADSLRASQEVKAFYARHEGAPIWNSKGRARDVLGVLDDSWQHGLDGRRYHVAAIEALLEQDDAESATQREILLSDAVAAYTLDMTGMRTRKAGAGYGFTGLPPSATPSEVLDEIAAGKNVRSVLNDLEPRSATYKRLQKALKELTEEQEENPAKMIKVRMAGTLRPAQRDNGVPALRARLGAKQQTPDALLYDDALFAAVTRFQRDSGMRDDGILGPDTLAALNRTNADRIDQLIVNMERLRWMEGPRPDKFVVVNIPAATLWAVEKGRAVFEMPVVVGRRERATPMLAAEITGIRFNPDWTVPPTIKAEDIVPKLRENPGYFLDKGMELIRRTPEGAETMDPTAVDWDNVTREELAAMEMIQMPGANNPLGRIRVLMPNRHSVYLHDTNEHGAFSRNQRAISSGCVRMEEPMKMAQFVMEEEGWDQKKLDSTLATGRTRDAIISRPIPVYFLYYTAWVDDKGRVVFGRDLYGWDAKLRAAMGR